MVPIDTIQPRSNQAVICIFFQFTWIQPRPIDTIGGRTVEFDIQPHSTVRPQSNLTPVVSVQAGPLFFLPMLSLSSICPSVGISPCFAIFLWALASQWCKPLRTTGLVLREARLQDLFFRVVTSVSPILQRSLDFRLIEMCLNYVAYFEDSMSDIYCN